MIKLLAGSDTYESYKAAKAACENLAEKLSLEIKVIDADEVNAQALWDELRQVGLFYTKQVYLLKRPFDNKSVIDFLVDKFDLLNGSHEIYLWQPAEPDNRLSLVKKLTTLKQIKVFTLPKTWEIAPWLADQVKALNLPISQSLQNIILERTAGDKFLISQELNKIQLFIQAKEQSKDTRHLSEQDLEILIPKTSEMQIWEVLDTLTLDNKAVALKKLNQFVNEDNIQYLLTMLSREITMLAKIKYASQNNVALGSLGIHEFVLKKAMPKVQKFTLNKLTKLSQAVFRLDVAIKRGKTDPVTGLFMVAMAW